MPGRIMQPYSGREMTLQGPTFQSYDESYISILWITIFTEKVLNLI